MQVDKSVRSSQYAYRSLVAYDPCAHMWDVHHALCRQGTVRAAHATQGSRKVIRIAVQSPEVSKESMLECGCIGTPTQTRPS